MVCAANTFKGSLTAVQACAAMARGAAAAGAVGVEVPVADGGDGTLEVLLATTPDARAEPVRVSGPLGEPVAARLGWLDAGTAVVELAQASGLSLVTAGPGLALAASSRGTGELIRRALEAGAGRVLVGLGGSACTDGGAGLLAALGARLLDAAGAPLADGGGRLSRLARLDLRGLHPRLGQARIEVAVDVTAPLLGPAGAAAVFAPQKGAGPAEVSLLEAGLSRLAEIAEAGGADPRIRDLPGAGAAGGCGWALAALGSARLRPGAALVCDTVGLDAALAGAALALTGEGRLDAQTAGGKAPAEVAARAARAGVPCAVVAGSVEAGAASPYVAARALSDGGGREMALTRAAELVEAAAADLVGRLLGGCGPAPAQ